MLRRALVIAIASASVLAPSSAQARDDDQDTTTTADTDDDGTITTGAAVTGVVYTTGGRAGPQCSWNRYSNFEFEEANGVSPREPPMYEDDPDTEISPEEVDRRNRELEQWWNAERRRRRQPQITSFNGEDHYVYAVRCPDRTGDLRIVPTTVDADDLIPGLYDTAVGRIQPPVPDVSPPFDVPGYVNLGMWLAVEPTNIESITAEAGPTAWITVSPAHDSISFDFDNGDTRTCDGFGEPIVDLETFDEGPCGYTYREKLPDDEAYLIEVGTTWNLPYTSSNGNGSLPAFTRTAVFPHNVDEIQTVGQRN